MKYMYINKSNKLDYLTRFNIVRQSQYKQYTKTFLAEKYNVSRQTIHKIVNKFNKDSVYGLEDHKPGKLREPMNPVFYANIVSYRKKTGKGALSIEKHFNKKGFRVSHNKINQVLKYENLHRRKGKMAKAKYVKYEADNINDQWHIDWSIDPFSKKKLLAIIDDKSRFIVFAGLFTEATAENSAIGLQKAINTYGSPKEIVSDNGSHFKKPHSKHIVVSPLREVEEKYAIKHIFIRPYYPQSNGKIERWFGSYKMEFPIMEHPDVKDCLTWVYYYNFERLHQSLDYETPAHVYLGVNSI
jgi:putative transposase